MDSWRSLARRLLLGRFIPHHSCAILFVSVFFFSGKEGDDLDLVARQDTTLEKSRLGFRARHLHA